MSDAALQEFGNIIIALIAIFLMIIFICLVAMLVKYTYDEIFER